MVEDLTNLQTLHEQLQHEHRKLTEKYEGQELMLTEKNVKEHELKKIIKVR